MLRAENCIAGTSTTGTGTLTLAACPRPPGGTDLYQAFSAQGFTGSLIVSYCIIEYTNATFSTASKQEKGIGTLALGGSITATTLARTTVQQTSTNMDTGAASYSVASPSAISIGTAANVLVFIGSSATDLPACLPYFENTASTLGALPVVAGGFAGTLALPTADTDNYYLFEWRTPMLVKRARVYIHTSFSGTTQLYGRLYAIGTNARPSKLLYDFGTFSGTNVLNSAAGTAIATGATGSGFFMAPGEYFFDLMPKWSAGGNGFLFAWTQGQALYSGRLGISSTVTPGIGPEVIFGYTATGGLTGSAPDPANVSSLAAIGYGLSSPIAFTLAAS